MRRGPFLLGVLVLAGCGGGSPPPHVTPKQPRLPSALTAPWRAQADAVRAQNRLALMAEYNQTNTDKITVDMGAAP